MPVLKRLFVVSVVILGAVSPVLAAESVAVTPVVHDELNRALDDLVGQVHGLGERWRDHFRRVDSPAERPLITLTLNWRQELALSTSQVQSLEKLRAVFQREATRLEAHRLAAEPAVTTKLLADPEVVDAPEPQPGDDAP